MKMKFLTLLALAVVSVMAANAKVIRITEADQAKEFFALNGGDTLVLAEGVWEDLEISFRSIDGTRAIPVVLKGETAGKTILKGVSSVSFSGEGVVVEDLYFEDPVTDRLERAIISFRTAPTFNASESVLRNVRITGFNTPIDVVNECKWVSIYGVNNTVENCSFEDKGWRGTTLVIWPEAGLPSAPSHIVRNNYFTRPRYHFGSRGGKTNGQEIIRIGDSNFSMTDARCIVENNVFEDCNGELEIVSIKSCNNIVRGNLFLGSEGTMTLRHGNGSLVEGNYFDGRNIPGTGGIRIVGENHVIRNNYFQNLAGEKDLVREVTDNQQSTKNDPGAPTGPRPNAFQDESGDSYYSAISIMKGVTNTAINGYFRAINVVIEDNVAVDCEHGIAVDIVNRSNQEQSMINSRISGNKFSSSIVAARVFNTPPIENVQWKNNVFEGGEFVGITAAEAGAVAGTIERREMPVFDFGPSWKNLYE